MGYENHTFWFNGKLLYDQLPYFLKPSCFKVASPIPALFMKAPVNQDLVGGANGLVGQGGVGDEGDRE